MGSRNRQVDSWQTSSLSYWMTHVRVKANVADAVPMRKNAVLEGFRNNTNELSAIIRRKLNSYRR